MGSVGVQARGRGRARARRLRIPRRGRSRGSTYNQGGYVRRRMTASLQGGEFVARAAVVPRGHRKLLERINRGP